MLPSCNSASPSHVGSLAGRSVRQVAGNPAGRMWNAPNPKRGGTAHHLAPRCLPWRAPRRSTLPTPRLSDERRRSNDSRSYRSDRRPCQQLSSGWVCWQWHASPDITAPPRLSPGGQRLSVSSVDCPEQLASTGAPCQYERVAFLPREASRILTTRNPKNPWTLQALPMYPRQARTCPLHFCLACNSVRLSVILQATA